jgi:carbon monoxide dehydrogenase subunit G
MIRLAEQTRLDAPRDTVWRSLSDPARLADALPNVSDLRVAGPGAFAATIRPETSTGVTPFDMEFRLRDLVEPERLSIAARAVQNERAMELDATLELTGDGAATIVDWRADARLLGPLGALAQRVLPDILRNEIDLALHAAAAIDPRKDGHDD